MNHLRTDVLVVGGGGAAARAAIEAFDAGARVALVTKGRFGTGGATGYVIADFAGLAVADGAEDSTDSPELHLQDILRAGLGMCDVELSRILVEESLRVVPDLEKWGVEPERTPSGTYLITQACFSSKPRNYKLKGHGRKILEALARQVRARNVTLLERSMVMGLGKNGDQVTGGLVLSGDGTPVWIDAGAVILATGGAGQLFEYNMNPPDITGDGYAIGFRAGAELFNMEFTQYGLGTVSPVTLFPFWLWPLKPVLRNAAGADLLPEYLPPGISAEKVMEVHAGHFPFTNRLPSRYLEIAVHKERCGGGASRGGAWADFRKSMDAGDLTDTARKLWPTTRGWFASRGMPLEDRPVEIACFAHAMNGGFRVDECGETSLKGLFAVGETAGGPHGADRLGGGMLTACQVFGRRAGRAAADWARRQTPAEASQEAIGQLAQRVEHFKAGSGPGRCKPADFRRRIQESAFRHLLLVRTENGLSRFRQELDAIEAELRQGCRIETARETMHALEVDNLLDTGKIIVQAALTRRETRGSHYREDYPETHAAAEWVIVRRGEQGEPDTALRPVATR